MSALGDARYAVMASIIWGLWALSWLAASLWHARTVKQARGGSYRLLLGIGLIGYVGLFIENPATARGLWRVAPWLGWPMVVLVGAGALFCWWARLHLGALWSSGIVRRAEHRVVESGPYGVVRHPIYTGMIAGAIGVAAVKPTPLALAGAALIALGFGLKARVEERFLAAELGEAEYAAYRRRVPMLVPFAR